MTKPNEPTLTCSERHSINMCPKHGETGNEPCAICFPIESNRTQFESCPEVVERLRNECLAKSAEWTPASAEDYTLHPQAWFDTDKAEAILHSWRERRVQELGEALREVLSSATPNQKEHPTMFAAWQKAEKALNSEQIRKG